MSQVTKLSSKTKLMIVSFSFLALLLLTPGMGILVSAQSDQQVQSSVTASFVQGSGPSASYFIVTVSVAQNQGHSSGDNRGQSSDDNGGNSHHGDPLQVKLSESLGGQTVGAGSCEVSFHGDQSSSSCSVFLPFEGSGTYDFYATVYGHNGQVLSVSSYDPLVEPEWR